MATLQTPKGRDFADFEALLKGREAKRLGNSTWIRRREANDRSALDIELHGTVIVKVFMEREKTIIECATGGWRTRTTKNRINAFAPEGWAIVQRKGEWLWWRDGEDKPHAPFADFDRFADGAFVIQEQAAR